MPQRFFLRKPRARRVASITALGVAMGLLVTGCAAPATENAQDSELVWAIEGSNLSQGHMDPQSSQLDVSAMVGRQVLDSLVYQEADGTFSPWLATSWTVSEDGSSYTFELRDDVTFHDGEPFNAEAVKVNFDRIVDPETASAQAASMLGVDFYAGTTVVDEYTVRVDFTQPYAPFLQAASTALLGFYSPAVIAEHSDDLKVGGPGISVGTGPFVLAEYTADQELIYTRNDDYVWGPHTATAPHVATLRIEILPESAVRAGALTSGQADIASQLPPNTASELSDPITVDSLELPGLPYSLYLNETYGFFADENVRRAFALGIDIDTAVSGIFFDQYPRAWSILSASTPDYDAELEGTWAFDPDQANELLDDAGWTERDSDGYRTQDGQRLSVRWISWTPVPDDRAALANAIQSDAKKIGIEIVRDVLEPGAYNEAYGPKQYDLTDWGFSGVDGDLLRNHLHTDGFQNASQVSDPDLDALLERAATSPDANVRHDDYVAVQQWNAEHVAIVPLYVPALITAATPNVDGLEFDLYGRPLFYDATVTP